MKLGKTTLLEIIEIVRYGLIHETDISQKLRELDLTTNTDGALELSDAYIVEHPRNKS